MILNSPGTLQIYLSADEQHRLKPYAYGKRAPIVINRNQVPPFQFVIPTDYANINSIKIISRETGVESERFSNMPGITTMAFPGYKIVKYPASALIGGGMFAEGIYYLRISNGAQTWESEEFGMKAYTGNMWRLEYCHSENFDLPGIGHIDYTQGYVNYFLITTEIGKPIYGYQETVKNRDGRNFFTQQIRYKASLFELILPEEVIDAMSYIPLHDTIRLIKGEKVYEVDELSINVEWQDQGDLAAVTFEFRVDSVAVVNGRGLTTVDCGTVDGGCFDVTYQAVAVLVDGGTDYDNFQYTTPGGAVVALQSGDIIVVESHADPAAFTLESYNGVGYSSVPTNPGEYVYEANTGRYFYDNNGAPIPGSLMTNRITSIAGNIVHGEAIPISTVEIYALLASGAQVLVGIGNSDEFTDTGLEIEIPDGMVAVKLVVSTTYYSNCPAFYDGPWIYLEPLSNIECMGDYASDAAAVTGGVLPGEYYCLTIDNVYGMPAAVVKRLAPFTGYTSDAAALASLGANVIFQLAAGNDLGMPSGMVRINVDGITTYDTDTAAGVGGVAVGEFYIWNCLVAGFQPYLIKKRVS